MTHWCRDIPRDEAVRAAEDGRSGPLPTLEKVIAAVTDRRPVDAGGGENVTGLRTERVTLEVTHDLDAPLGDWIVQVLDESLGFDESVRVVEEAKLAPAANADGGSNHAPAASGAAGTGWLTAEERAAIQWAISEGFDEEVLRNLLARSTPPEVVHPECVFDEFSGCGAVHAWNICAADFRKALAAAGVTVKEVGK